MAVFKCKMCGGAVEFEQGSSVGVCDSCGTKQTLPKLDDDKKATLYDRANHFRRNNEFDKAEGIYEQILNEDNTDAEVYWSLVLCKYGIEYVEDPTSHKRVPTVNRAQYTAIFDDENYKSALQYADEYQREIYEEEARQINEIQKGILAVSQQEEAFDVFICYKETDTNGRRTHDSVLANDLYHQLTQEGFKVFFARITLEDKLGSAYEPYIFAALNSAKAMVVLGTKPEHFNAVWVKNEWSRYLSLVKKSGGRKVLIPAYRDMDPYDLPEEFSHLQAQDMSKLGFMQDLIRGIKKIAAPEENRTVVKEIVKEVKADTATLLKRASLFLLDGNWNSASEYCEKVLNADPENAEAYLIKLMSDLEICQENDFYNYDKPFISNGNYKKIIMFGDSELKNRISEYANSASYNYASKQMASEMYIIAMKEFEEIPTYKDSAEKIAQLKETVNKLEKEYYSLQEEKRQEEKRIQDHYNDVQLKAKTYKKWGWLSLLFGFILMLSPLLLLETGLGETLYVFLCAGPIVMSTVCLILIGKGNKLSAKNYKEKTSALTELDIKYKPTQVMINNITNKPINQKRTDNVAYQSNNTTLYDVILSYIGRDKLQVIAVIREVTGLGLADAKNLADFVPSTIKRAVTVEEANQIKNRFETIGAIIELR